MPQELENNGALSDQAREEARIIKEQSLRIRQLIEDLNLTSKLEYQSYPLRIASFYTYIYCCGRSPPTISTRACRNPMKSS